MWKLKFNTLWRLKGKSLLETMQISATVISNLTPWSLFKSQISSNHLSTQLFKQLGEKKKHNKKRKKTQNNSLSAITVAAFWGSVGVNTGLGCEASRVCRHPPQYLALWCVFSLSLSALASLGLLTNKDCFGEGGSMWKKDNRKAYSIYCQIHKAIVHQMSRALGHYWTMACPSKPQIIAAMDVFEEWIVSTCTPVWVWHPEWCCFKNPKTACS